MSSSNEIPVLDTARQPVACAPSFPDFVVYPRLIVEELRDISAIPAGHIALKGDFDPNPIASL